jgi:hypothetical protein
MNNRTKSLLFQQGYTDQDIAENQNINLLARWTPLACAFLGALGILLQSPYYFFILGLFTSIGAVTNHSFYDFLYKFFIQKIIDQGDIPEHGNPRRFGCAIGAIVYITSGTGFFLNNPYCAYIPSLFIVTAAFIAAFTQWCFASTLYNLIFKKKEKCC